MSDYKLDIAHIMDNRATMDAAMRAVTLGLNDGVLWAMVGIMVSVGDSNPAMYQMHELGQGLYAVKYAACTEPLYWIETEIKTLDNGSLCAMVSVRPYPQTLATIARPKALS